MTRIKETLVSLWKDEEGPTMVEYGLMVALVAVAIIVGATALGANTNTHFGNVATKIGAIAVP
jgi:pilus assembly protein Flp/PilA